MNDRGFTLIELMAVLVIVSVWAAIGFQKFAVATDFANTSAGQMLVSDLNCREMGMWGSELLGREYESDDSVWEHRHDYLSDPAIKWISLNQDGESNAVINGVTVSLNRTPSTRATAAAWVFR